MIFDLSFYCVFYCVRTQRITSLGFRFIVCAEHMSPNKYHTPDWFYCVRPLKGRTHNKTIQSGVTRSLGQRSPAFIQHCVVGEQDANPPKQTRREHTGEAARMAGTPPPS